MLLKHGDEKFDECTVEQDYPNAGWIFFSTVRDSDLGEVSLQDIIDDQGRTYTLYFDGMVAGTRKKFTAR